MREERLRLSANQRRIAVLLTLGCAHQSCFALSPIDGIAEAFLQLLVLVGAFFMIGGASVSRSRLKGALVGAGIFVALLVALAIWLLTLAWRAQTPDDEATRGRRERTQKSAALAETYLQAVCAKDRIRYAEATATKAEGLRIDVDLKQTLHFDDAPPAEEETLETLEGRRRFGDRSAAELRRTRFESPLFWIRQAEASEVLRKSDFAFVESSAASSRDVVRHDREASDPVGEDSTSSGALRSARFILTIRDVSSLEDRKHWVARGDIQLADRASGKVVARYQGFVANRAPHAWAKDWPWEFASPCPGIERAHLDEDGRFDAVNYFFEQVVRSP